MSNIVAKDFQMPSLSSSDFLKELGAYLKAGEGSTSINLTHKRVSSQTSASDQELSSNVIEHPPQFEKNTKTYYVLIRAKYGKDKSLTTAVAPEDLTEFWSKYSQMLKSGFVGLQKSKNKAKK
ncbi:hypothetical protein JCM33374_g692 [Metschnikowia sp. JCM 33374]|nr:hypothetical protein JCM33374_g692 [Metschnikowia sp. JCM 33374]